MKELNEMTTGELIEELRQRREYDEVFAPQLDEQGQKIEALEAEVNVLRRVTSGQIVQLVIASGFDPRMMGGQPPE